MSDKLFGFYERKTLSEPAHAVQRITGDGYLNRLFTDELIIIKKSVTIPDPQRIIEIGGAGGITKLVWPEVETTDVRISPQGGDFKWRSRRFLQAGRWNSTVA